MENDNYEDIINLSRPVSSKHLPLSMEQRAAQFAPFAALTGFSDEVKETARLTGDKIEIDEEIKIILDEKISIIQKEINKRPKINITYFVKDDKKNGGKYVEISGIIKKIDKYENKIILEDLTSISIEDILIIEGDIFKGYNFI